jgi:hypothetical protein
VATAFQPGAFQPDAFQIDGGASFGDGALSATGTGTALFVGASTSSAAAAATGTGTATLVGASTAVAPFSVTGTGTASFGSGSNAASRLEAFGGCDSDKLLLNDGSSFVLLNDGTSLLQINTGSPSFVGTGIVTGALSATGTGTGLFVGAPFASGVLSATGTGTATFASPVTSAEGALSVTGTGTASFVGAALVSGVLSARGVAAEGGDGVYQPSVFQNNVFQCQSTATVFVGASDADGVVEPPVGTPGGVAAPGAWRGYGKKKKKKDELDDLIAQLKEQVVPWREAQVGAQIALLAEINQAEAITLDNTLAQIEAEIANLKEVMAEIDDEEAILLLM